MPPLQVNREPEIAVCEGVYNPSDDTHLLAGKILCLKTVLDMGTGTGYLGIKCALHGSAVTAVDISQKALSCAKSNARRNGVTMSFVLSDLFASVHGSFDEIIFNPPYLPSDPGEPEMWSGGQDGLSTIRRFIGGSSEHLKRGGIIEIILSDLTDIGSLIREFQEYDFSVLGCQTFQFETIYVYALRRRRMC